MFQEKEMERSMGIRTGLSSKVGNVKDERACATEVRSDHYSSQ